MVDITKFTEEDSSTASLSSGASSIVRKFVGDVVREDYANPLAPDLMEASKEEDLKEYNALHSALPDAYDDSTPYGSGATDFFLRSDIARSKTLEDKVSKFKEHFPDAQIRMESINGKNYLLGRNNESERWKRIDSFGADLAAGTFSVATGAAFGGEAAGAAAGAKYGGAFGGIAGAAIGAAGGYLLGTIGDKAIEKGRGYSKDESYAPDTQDYLTAGLGSVFSLAGKAIGTTLNKSAKALTGADAPGTVQSPLTGRAIDFAKEEGLPVPTAGSTNLSGSRQAMYAQAIREDPATQLEAMRRPMEARAKLIEYAKNKGFDGVDPKVLQEIIDAERADIDRLFTSVSSREIEFNDAAETLSGLFNNWEKEVDGHFTLRYKKFFDNYGNDMSFDLSSAQSEARKIKDGILQKGADKEVTSNTGLLDTKGNPITKTETVEGGPIKTSMDPEGRLYRLLDRLDSLDPNMNQYTAPNGNTYSALESLKQLRTDMGALTKSQDPLERHYAGRMYSAINDVFDNAIVNVSDPKLNAKAVSEWKRLSSDWKAKLALEDITPVARMADMDITQFADWSKSLIKPGKYNSLQFLSNILGPDGQQVVKDMFYTRLVAGERNPKGWVDTVSSTFKQFTDVNDTKTLDFLMTPNDRKTILDWAKSRDRLENSTISKLVDSDLSNSAAAIELATKGNVDELRTNIALAGGINSKFGQSIQAGFMQHLVNTASRTEHLYGDILNTGELVAQLSKAKEKGVLEVIFPDPKAQKWFSDFIDYHNVVGMLPSQGAGLATGAMGSKALKGGVVIAEKAISGDQVGALRRMWEIGTMGIPHKYIGRWMSREATKQGEKELLPGIKAKLASGANLTATTLATIRKSAQFMTYLAGQEKQNDLQQYDKDIVNKQYNPGGM